MLRILFSVLVFIHGLIHLMGFVKEWNLAPIEQLTGKTLLPLSGATAKVAGLLWLAGCLLFLAAGVTYLMRSERWWALALAGVVLSQFLVILYWPDAKAGTIANIIILLVSLVGYAEWSFGKMAERETTALLAEAGPAADRTVAATDLIGLPPPVQQWLERAGVVGHPYIHTVRLRQTGEMRIEPDGSWMPVAAVQHFTTRPPGFLWEARVRMAPGVHIAGRDLYQGGHGFMLIKLLSTFPLVDASGPETDQGTLLRYLGETIWFPTVVLSDYMEWEAVDDTTARVRMTYGDVSADALFFFNEQGDPVRFEAERYYEEDGTYSLKTWIVSMGDHEALDGLRIPTTGEVKWRLEEGDYTWYRLEIEEISYNP